MTNSYLPSDFRILSVRELRKLLDDIYDVFNYYKKALHNKEYQLYLSSGEKINLTFDNSVTCHIFGFNFENWIAILKMLKFSETESKMNSYSVMELILNNRSYIINRYSMVYDIRGLVCQAISPDIEKKLIAIKFIDINNISFVSKSKFQDSTDLFYYVVFGEQNGFINCLNLGIGNAGKFYVRSNLLFSSCNGYSSELDNKIGRTVVSFPYKIGYCGRIYKLNMYEVRECVDHLQDISAKYGTVPNIIRCYYNLFVYFSKTINELGFDCFNHIKIFLRSILEGTLYDNVVYSNNVICDNYNKLVVLSKKVVSNEVEVSRYIEVIEELKQQIIMLQKNACLFLNQNKYCQLLEDLKLRGIVLTEDELLVVLDELPSKYYKFISNYYNFGGNKTSKDNDAKDYILKLMIEIAKKQFFQYHYTDFDSTDFSTSFSKFNCTNVDVYNMDFGYRYGDKKLLGLLALSIKNKYSKNGVQEISLSCLKEALNSLSVFERDFLFKIFKIGKYENITLDSIMSEYKFNNCTMVYWYRDSIISHVMKASSEEMTKNRYKFLDCIMKLDDKRKIWILYLYYGFNGRRYNVASINSFLTRNNYKITSINEIKIIYDQVLNIYNSLMSGNDENKVLKK